MYLYTDTLEIDRLRAIDVACSPWRYLRTASSLCSSETFPRRYPRLVFARIPLNCWISTSLSGMTRFYHNRKIQSREVSFLTVPPPFHVAHSTQTLDPKRRNPVRKLRRQRSASVCAAGKDWIFGQARARARPRLASLSRRAPLPACPALSLLLSRLHVTIRALCLDG